MTTSAFHFGERRERGGSNLQSSSERDGEWTGPHFKVPFVLIRRENGADDVSEHFIPKRKSLKTALKQILLRVRGKQKKNLASNPCTLQMRRYSGVSFDGFRVFTHRLLVGEIGCVLSF